MKRSTIIGIAVALGVVCIVTAAGLVAGVFIWRPDWLPFRLPGAARAQALLAVPDRRGEADLVLLTLGDDLDGGTRLAEEAAPGTGQLLVWRDGGFVSIGGGGYGGFLPDGRTLIYQGQVDGETSVWQLPRGADQAATVFETEGNRFSLYAGAAPDRLVIVEPGTGGRARCYISRQGAEAERVARGDSCEVSGDGLTILLAVETSQGLSLSTISVVDGQEQTLLEDGEDIESFSLAADGSRLAYVHSAASGETRLVVLSAEGAPVHESETYYAISAYDFAPSGSQIYYIAEDDAGDVVLATEAGEIASGYALAASFSADGGKLIYTTSDIDGESSLWSYDMALDEATEILQGNELGFGVVASPPRLLVREVYGDELTLYSISLDGSDVVELLDEAGYYVQTVQVLPGQDRAYILLQEDGGGLSVYVASLSAGDGFFLLEDWADIRLLNLGGDAPQLLFAGREEARDPDTLYRIDLVEGADAVEVDDDAEDFRNAVFAERGGAVIYTAAVGDDSDEVEVRRWTEGEAAGPEVMYSEAFLVDVAWDDLNPFTGGFVAFSAAEAGSSFCPGAPLVQSGEELDDVLEQEGENCYRIRVSEEMEITISVLAEERDLDSRMYLYDRQGDLLEDDDDGGPGLNPRIRYTFEAGGIYFVKVRGYSDDDAGPYVISVREGSVDTGFETAVPLSYDAVMQGQISRVSEVFLEEFGDSLFGVVYSFAGTTDDWIQVDVDPEVAPEGDDLGILLFSPSREVLTVGYAGNPGFDLQYFLASSGQHYLLVGILSDYPPERDVFFDISLSRGEPPEPGGGPISFGESVEAFVRGEPGDEWTFRGEAGQEVTITMRSSSLDSTLRLLAPDGRELAFDDDGLGYPDSMIGFTLPSTGTYSIVAADLGGRPGAYTLSLTLGYPGFSGEIERGQTVSGDLEPAARDRWTFTAEAGESVTIVMTSQVFDTYLELYGPDGSMLASNDDAGSTRRSEIARFSLTQTGSYRIIARGYSGSHSGRYELTLTVQ
jgi:hypothetical protein